MTKISNTPLQYNSEWEAFWEARSYCKGYDGYWMEVLHYGATKELAIKNANDWVASHIISGEIKYGTVVLEGIRVSL